MILPGSYANGFAPRDGSPLYPELWRGCVGAWNPGLGVSGLTLRDQSGFQNNGVLTNGPTWAVNQGRYALSFDGTNDYVDTGNSVLRLGGLSQLTMMLWARRATTSSAVTISVVSGVDYLAIAPWIDGNVYFQISPSTPSIVDTSLDFNHWAMTLSGSNLRGYKNGIEVLNTSGPSVVPTISSSFLFGYYSSQTRYSTGLMDDIRIYSRALSAQEIRTLATRRGIAYEMAPRRRSSVQVTVAPLRYNLFSGSIGNTDMIGAS